MTRIFDFLPLMLGTPERTASGTAATGGGGTQLVTMLIMFGLIIVVFYFLVIRPQNKKQKDAQKMLSSLHKGDRVATIGGLRGTVMTVKDDVVVLKVDENTKMEFNKSAVSTVLERKDEPQEVKE